MSARGRGPDSTLVHMSPREVEGLQKLAVANGTTLTINPDTGLPEAGALESMLPTLFGAAATYLTGGVINPAVIAAAVGGVTALTSKDLGKGLMAGLGAYGGAGLVSGLAGFGAADIGEKAVSSAAADAAAEGLVNQSIMTDTTGVMSNPYAAAMQKGVGDRMAGASYSDKFGAGLSKAMSDPMGAANAVGGGSTIAGLTKVAGAISPLLAGETGNTVQTVTKRPLPRPRQPSVYDNMSQTFERYAANGGLMGLAHGGSVSYADGGMSLDDAYQSVLGRAPDDAGRAYWSQANVFGDSVDANELASLRASALGGTDTADKAAAQNFGISNAGAGFAATAPVATQATLAAPAAQVAPAAPAAPVAETAPLTAAQVFPTEVAANTTGNTAANNTGIATLLPPAPVAETAPMALNNALTNMGAGKGMSVQDAAMKVLGRQLSPTELSNWNASIGSDDVTAAELSKFSIAAQPERALGINNTNNAIREMYLERLGRYPDASGLAYFSNKFGDKVEPEERAIFNAMTTEEFEANVARDKKNLPTVVTDLTTAATNYIAPGVGGSTGAGQIGGGTTINPNGTITTSPRIPGIRVGGFSGMTDVKRTYTDSGGSLGYTSPVFEDLPSFNKTYTNTGSQKEMYDYLMGKGDRPTKEKNKDGTFRELSRSYNEAVLGVPGSTNAKRIWNPLKGEYFRNPDYMRQRTIRDPDTKAKSTINYMSINQAKAALAKTPLEGNALAYWSIENFVDPETLAEATGMNQNQVTKLLADAKADKSYVKKVAGGGLLSLANGGLAGVGYADGGLPDKEFTNSVTGVKYYFDFDNGIYRPETSVKDGITYKWNPVTNKYETGASNASGIAGLMDMSGGINAGDARGPGTGNEGGIPGLNIDPIALAMARVANIFTSDQSGKTAPVTDATFNSTQAGRDYAGVSGKSSWGKSGNADQDIGGITNAYADPSDVIGALSDRQAVDRQAASDARENVREGIATLGSGISPSDKSGGLADLANAKTDRDASFQASRDAITSASSPTASAANAAAALAAGQPAPFNSKGVAAPTAPTATAISPTATFSGLAAVEGLTREERDVIAAARTAAENAVIDAAAKDRADKAAENAAAIARANEREAQAVTMAGLFDSMPAANASTSDAPASDAPPGGGDVSEGSSGPAGGPADGGDGTGDGRAKGGYIGHYAQGGLGSLGGYSDGGRLLRGPGDGVSDSIPASIGNRQPARLADGEFVVPARIVSELGNGSTEAGARALYKMMARIQANRRKTTGKNSVAVDSKAHKYLPA